MPDTEFRVSQFKNRNGVTSWRVSGWRAGVRIRKNFKSRQGAAAAVTGSHAPTRFDGRRR